VEVEESRSEIFDPALKHVGFARVRPEIDFLSIGQLPCVARYLDRYRLRFVGRIHEFRPEIHNTGANIAHALQLHRHVLALPEPYPAQSTAKDQDAIFQPAVADSQEVIPVSVVRQYRAKFIRHSTPARREAWS